MRQEVSPDLNGLSELFGYRSLVESGLMNNLKQKQAGLNVLQWAGRIVKMIFKLIIITGVSATLVLLLGRVITSIYAQSRIDTLSEIENAPTAVVFGAGLWRDGSPTPVLRDRVKTAADLYFSGKVEKLLMSGDNRYVEYNEPAAMRSYALQLGVPDEAIVLDFAGRRTYDTCYRARNIFEVERVILVTQEFHLPRAVYVCNALGVEAHGTPADQRQYRRGSLVYWNIRETLATLVALWEVHITQPLPVLGDPERKRVSLSPARQ